MRAVRTIALFISLSSLLAASCGDRAMPMPPRPEIDLTRPECENLNPGSCMAPWPSTRYLVDDVATATGRRIEIPAEAMLRNRMDIGVDPTPYNRFDGFSLNTPIATAIDGGVLDTSPLAGEQNIGGSIAPDSPTVLIDAETGERIAHIAEIDAWGGSDPTRTTLYLRPIRPLAENRRFVVAIRGLAFVDGTPAVASPYFAALRDDDVTAVGELESRRASFEEIFAVLTDAGIARETLIEAWDFRTGTSDSFRRELLHMRDDALTRIGDRGTSCTVETVEEDFGHTEIFRRFSGTFEVPLYAESEEPGSRLVRGTDGLPEFQRMGVARFTAVIPYSVSTSTERAPLVIWGHGLLGLASDIGLDEDAATLRVTGRFAPIFEELAMAAVGTDWWGLSADDNAALVEEISELSRFSEIPDRLMQAMINFVTLTRNFAGRCGELPEWNIAGAQIIDPTDRRYVGISGGAVLGPTYAALTPDIDRFAFVAGGVGWPMLISRSFVFFPFNLILGGAYRDKRERDVMLAMTAHLWDLADGATFAPLIMGEPLPGAPERQILLQSVLNDALVHNVSSDYLVRSAGLSHIGPSVYVPYDVPRGSYGDASGQVMYDTGVEDLEPGTILPPQNGAHGGITSIPALRQQLDVFLRDGTIETFCDGPCDPD